MQEKRTPHFVVCLKQVPDSAQITVHPVTNTIMRQGVPTIVNPYDLFALEEALRWKDRLGGRVTALSMGPPMAEDVLKKAISFGADEAILVTDKSFAGADTLATSYALAAAIRKIGETHPVDVVFTGKQTIDGDTAQVGPGLAIRLGAQLLSYVARITELNAAAGSIRVERRSEGGVQVLASKLPCVITMLEGTNEMRFATMPAMFSAARYQVPNWDKVAAGVADVTKIGLKGSPTVVTQVFGPSPRSVKVEVLAGDTLAATCDALVDRLFERHPKLAARLVAGKPHAHAGTEEKP
jgi:electron transfer flavoprotein beta subunit